MMKLKTIVLASACAIGLSATAADWFNAKIGEYTQWPAQEGVIIGGAWENTDSATLRKSNETADSFLEIDADESEPLIFEATNGKAIGADSNKEVEITTKIAFTPFDTVPTTVQEGAKAAVIVVKKGEDYGYYGLAKKDGVNENGWIDLGIPAETGKVVTITVKVEEFKPDPVANQFLVSYKIGDFAPSNAVYVSEKSLQMVNVVGTGSMHELSSTCDPVMRTITIDNNIEDNGLAVDVVSNATTGAFVDYDEGYKVAHGDSVVVYFKPIEGKAFVDHNNTSLNLGAITADTTVDKTSTAEIKTGDAKAKIGTTFYISLVQAASNVVAGQTIELTDDFEGMSFKMAASKIGSITLDLGGHTWTAYGSPVNEDVLFDINAGNSLKVINGTVKATSAIQYAYYAYAEMLEFDNVTLDLTDMTPATGSDSRANTAFTIQNGSVTFKNTTVTLKEGMRLATFIDRAGHQYTMGTLTIDGCTVPGDIFLLGEGKLAFANDGKITGNVYAGAASCSGYTDTNCVVGCGFVARVGNVRGAKMAITTETGASEVTAQLFFDFGDAVAALASTEFDKKLTLLADQQLTELDVPVDCVVDVNDKVLTLGECDIKIQNNVTITNSGTSAEKGLKNLARVVIDEDKTLDLSALSWGKGLIDAGQAVPTASFTLYAGAKYIQGIGDIFKDEITNIFSTVEGYKIVLTKTETVATITTEKDEGGKSVAPGGSPVEVEAESAEAATNGFTIVASSPDTEIVSDADYAKYFQPKAVALSTPGQYRVYAELKPEITKAEEPTQSLAASLGSVASGAESAEVTNAKPGLYYSVKYTDTVGSIDSADEGDRAQAGSDGKVTIAMPKKSATDKAQFYRIQVNTADKGMFQ